VKADRMATITPTTTTSSKDEDSNGLADLLTKGLSQPIRNMVVVGSELTDI
jgi:hypothetical protein